jgi:hypothetical protein
VVVVVVEGCLCCDLVGIVPIHHKLEQLEVVEGEEVEALVCYEHLACDVVETGMESVLAWEYCDAVGVLVVTKILIWVVFYVKIVHDLRDFHVDVNVSDEHIRWT